VGVVGVEGGVGAGGGADGGIASGVVVGIVGVVGVEGGVGAGGGGADGGIASGVVVGIVGVVGVEGGVGAGGGGADGGGIASGVVVSCASAVSVRVRRTVVRNVDEVNFMVGRFVLQVDVRWEIGSQYVTISPLLIRMNSIAARVVHWGCCAVIWYCHLR
jgi:hypothetical protein